MNFFNNIERNSKALSGSRSFSIFTLWALLLFGFIQSASATENMLNLTKNVSWVQNTTPIPVLESITLTIESTTLISGSKNISIKAIGNYSYGSPQNITSFVKWKYDDKLISTIDNNGLITVRPITINTRSTITAYDPITTISSNPKPVKFESIAMTGLRFTKTSPSCFNIGNNPVSCVLSFEASFNDGSYKPYVNFTTDDLNKMVKNTKPTPTKVTHIPNGGIILDYTTFFPSVNIVVDYNGFHLEKTVQVNS